MEMFTKLEERLNEVLDEPCQIRGFIEGLSAGIYAILIRRDKFKDFVEFCLEKTIYNPVIETIRFQYYVKEIVRRVKEIPKNFVQNVYNETMEYLKN